MFHHEGNAYAFFYHMPKLNFMERFTTKEAAMVKWLKAGTNFGEVRINTAAPEESRQLRKTVKVTAF